MGLTKCARCGVEPPKYDGLCLGCKVYEFEESGEPDRLIEFIEHILAEVERERDEARATLRDARESDGRWRVMHYPIEARPILYTDEVGGRQTMRDDLWAVTTAELNQCHAAEQRLADVERGRAADVRRLGVATGRRFIPEERIADIDVVEQAMVTVRVQAEAAKEAIAAAEQRLARLRPLVRAVILWERLRGYVGELEARIVMLNIIRNHFDPTDRAWATEEER